VYGDRSRFVSHSCGECLIEKGQEVEESGLLCEVRFLRIIPIVIEWEADALNRTGRSPGGIGKELRVECALSECSVLIVQRKMHLHCLIAHLNTKEGPGVCVLANRCFALCRAKSIGVTTKMNDHCQPSNAQKSKL